MTCIAVKVEKKFIHLCGDTEISYWWYGRFDMKNTKELKDKSKIYQVNGLSFWGAGNLDDLLWFKEFCKTNMPKGNRLDDIESFMLKFYAERKGKEPDRRAYNHFIIIYKGKVFLVEEYAIYEIDKYTCIWSWRFYARTMLHIWKSAKEAVDVARELASWVGWETTEIKIPIK